MIIKTVQTLVFEYPEDYKAEVEWNKKRDGDWVHQSTDTICSVYTLTNNYLIPTKAKHSFVDNAYFEAEQTEPQMDGVWNAGYKTGYDKGYKDAQKVKDSQDLVKDLVKALPQRDCTEALTLLWIKNMVTDEEFYRIDARLKQNEPIIEVYNGNADKENWQCITIKSVEDKPQTERSE